MNEQIQELLQQSTDNVLGVPVVDQKKFAELIVRACASRVRFTDLLKCEEDSDNEILLQASVQLKQHFGVEE